jgi:predicted PhzF superfamily epimerase YddE/YHI9
MQRRYVTVDVFTDRPFGGNPLAGRAAGPYRRAIC